MEEKQFDCRAFLLLGFINSLITSNKLLWKTKEGSRRLKKG